MVDFFDYIYNSIKGRKKILLKIRFYSFLRVIVRVSANILIPVYFLLTKNNKCYSLIPSDKNEQRMIVSLTSFPARIHRIWLVIESILRQSQKPDKIVLWLSKEQFSSLDLLPSLLLKQRKRGLEIRLVSGDIRSHKKYYYAFKEFPDDYIVTIDDDVFYNSKLLFYLDNLSKRFPLAICCNNARRIKIEMGEIAPYLYWQTVNTEQDPNFEIIAIGTGGILYPPKSLYNDVFNIDIFTKYCLFADDVWLNIMARLEGTCIAKSTYNSEYLPVFNFKNTTLMTVNVNEGFNDIQLQSIRNYYIKALNLDPYKNIL